MFGPRQTAHSTLPGGGDAIFEVHAAAARQPQLTVLAYRCNQMTGNAGVQPAVCDFQAAAW
jgi:hypothetical protein